MKIVVLVILIILLSSVYLAEAAHDKGKGKSRDDEHRRDVKPHPSQFTSSEDGEEPWQLANLVIYQGVLHSKNKTVMNVTEWISNIQSISMNYADAFYFASQSCGDRLCTTSEAVSKAFGVEVSREDILEGRFRWGVFVRIS